ncbi:TolC family protein [Flexithrix dorotheae]|uniref:TolC family protein n=1 Tax=Flexithrix dorotheae TaxID=70993 RepID=UPI000381F9D0|nr:TolC family protein [Flexithrix dorotheae]
MKNLSYNHLIISFLMITSCFQSFGQVNQEPTVPLKWDLSNCISYAIANNITVKQVEMAQQSSDVNLEQSKAAWLPSLSATASQNLTRGTSIDPITSDFLSQKIHSTSLGINAQMTLYGGNKINNQIKQNKMLVEQNSLFVEESKNNITLEVTKAFLLTLYYREGIEIADHNLNASARQLEQTQALYDAGSVAAKDLADIQSQYASDQYAMVSAQNAYDQQVLTLKQLLELEPGQEFEPSFPASDLEVKVLIPDKMEVYQRSLEFLPEIKASQMQMDISSIDLKIAKAGYQPTLALVGRLSSGFTSTQPYTFSEQLDNNFNQGIGLSLSIPIFSNLKNKSNVQLAKIAMESANLDRIATKKEVYRKVESAHQSATGAQGEMDAAKIQVEAAKVSYDLSQEQYELGLINTTELLIDQNNYLTAQQKYLQTKYTTLLYFELLQFYQGEPIKL